MSSEAECPQCHSESVTWDRTTQAQCWDCDWKGSSYDLLDKEDTDIEDKRGNDIR